MFGRLLLIFLLTPLVELALLIQVDRLIGFWPTMGIIVATGITGSFLAKREGLSVWRRFNQRLNEGGLPGRELVDGVIILTAGALLLTPGVLTDVIGFVGLIPLTRAPIRRLLLKRLRRRVAEGSMQFHVGGFGVSAPEAHRAPAEADRAADRTWHGTGRQVPRHAEETSSSEPSHRDRDDDRT